MTPEQHRRTTDWAFYISLGCNAASVVADVIARQWRGAVFQLTLIAALVALSWLFRCTRNYLELQLETATTNRDAAKLAYDDYRQARAAALGVDTTARVQ